jgi:hypothetical protein
VDHLGGNQQEGRGKGKLLRGEEIWVMTHICRQHKQTHQISKCCLKKGGGWTGLRNMMTGVESCSNYLAHVYGLTTMKVPLIINVC